VRALLCSKSVDHVLVAARDVAAVAVRLADTGVDPERWSVVLGGADRGSSVASALAEGLRRFPEAHTVLVHDAARPLTPPALVAALVAAVAGGHDAVVPVLPLADTVKEVDPAGVVLGTADRSMLRAVQTPQAFRAALLWRAYAEAAKGAPATDDAGLVERLGEPVHTLPGDPLAFKITTPWDLRIAELLVGQ
jgi:2-C-methyl-D-erythritol 4-phosphate cytidylyltransferase